MTALTYRNERIRTICSTVAYIISVVHSHFDCGSVFAFTSELSTKDRALVVVLCKYIGFYVFVSVHSAKLILNTFDFRIPDLLHIESANLNSCFCANWQSFLISTDDLDMMIYLLLNAWWQPSWITVCTIFVLDVIPMCLMTVASHCLFLIHMLCVRLELWFAIPCFTIPSVASFFCTFFVQLPLFHSCSQNMFIFQLYSIFCDNCNTDVLRTCIDTQNNILCS